MSCQPRASTTNNQLPVLAFSTGSRVSYCLPQAKDKHPCHSSSSSSSMCAEPNRQPKHVLLVGLNQPTGSVGTALIPLKHRAKFTAKNKQLDASGREIGRKVYFTITGQQARTRVRILLVATHCHIVSGLLQLQQGPSSWSPRHPGNTPGPQHVHWRPEDGRP